MYEQLKRRNSLDDIKNKAEVITEKKISLEEYSRILKRELVQEDSRKIDKYIEAGEYDKAVNYVEEKKDIDLELPLKNIVTRNLGVGHRGIIEEDRLILNKKLKDMSMLRSLKEELSTCSSFLFIVSFIRYSGLQLLISQLKELEKMGIKGKVLTSVYMNITEPKAIRKLMEFSNIEVKIYNSHRDSFHTKAYIFNRLGRLGTGIIGSSNISHQALLCGEEWNIKVGEVTGEILKDSTLHFNKLWNSEEAISVTDGLIERYEKYRKDKDESRNFTYDFFSGEDTREEITPNSMQKEILNNLVEMRRNKVERALAIAATGTGKTFLSAFDVVEVAPKRLLFLAHREELLKGAVATYERFFPREEIGLLTGNDKEYNKKYLFATVQTLSKDEYLEKYTIDEFDYIVVDEFHHSTADSYMKIINYFKPKFLLGLTATPERMDGKDILEVCHYNVAGEIRLKEALERELLVPFHYFGLSDESLDYNEIPEKNGRLVEKILSENLRINSRVDFVLSKVQEYHYDGEKMCSIGFCVDKKHARYMADEFEKKGIKSKVILADTPQKERTKILEDLKKNKIEIIFTVDIFNEGIDIPQLNLLLFLRPTESSTVFIQQLGRGLRKHKGKSYVTILDFIGNYNRSFVGAAALTRELGEKQGKLKKNIIDGFSGLPGSSHVEFDRICQRRILNKVGDIRYTSKNYLKERYLEIRAKYDRPLRPMDFLYERESYETLIGAYGSFYSLKKAMGDMEKHEIIEEKIELELLERLDSMIPVKRSHELIILQEMLLNERTEIGVEEIESILRSGLKDRYKKVQRTRIIRAFKELSEAYKKQTWAFGEWDEDRGVFTVTPYIISLSLLSGSKLRNDIRERLEYALYRYQKEFKGGDGSLEIHMEYSRLDLQILLDSKVPKGSWRAGYAVAGEEICLFITMEKEGVEDHLMYDNYFDNQEIVQWISQNKTSHSSKIGEMFVEHRKQGKRIHIFIRRSREIQGTTQDFIYLGEGDYYTSNGDKPMYIKWKLHTKVPDKIFLDLTN